MMNFPPIKTDYWIKPIPIRSADWTAWFDGWEERYTATGTTRQQAIDDLLAWYADFMSEGDE